MRCKVRGVRLGTETNGFHNPGGVPFVSNKIWEWSHVGMVARVSGVAISAVFGRHARVALVSLYRPSDRYHNWLEYRLAFAV